MNIQEIPNTEIIDYINNLNEGQLRLARLYINELLENVDLKDRLKKKADAFDDTRRFHSIGKAFNNPKGE